jgi:2-iminobutanoate/2-iminopropanoate deaminase
MKHEAVEADLPAMGLPFSWGVRLRNLVFIAGQGPLGRDGKIVEGDIRAQTKATLENLKKVVDAAGSSLENVLSVTVYLKDLNDYGGLNEVYALYFKKEPRPARAVVQAQLLFGMRVEMHGIAFVPDQ